MYSLDINFLKDRPTHQDKSEKKVRAKLPAGSMLPLYIGVAVGLSLPVLFGAGWFILQAKNSELEQIVVQLEQENQKLDTQLSSINKIKDEVNAVKAETQSLVAVFDQIRPWSAMLQDLRDRIPATVQIENIKQTLPSAPEAGKPEPNPAGGVELIGYARSFNDVNDFLLILQQSNLLNGSEARITGAELVDAPIKNPITTTTGINIKPPQVVRYTIQSSLSNIPASDLMQELERKGTVGLVSRIRSLQKTGVLQR
ncbi:PilN domain-containing protein [Calothrix sp. 336/3]|uniref:PilN domain-containing protein n=1 Tax=Calothrix sp. 336/3 TaxID=1337936 RepID=UPI0004E31460|nr:PilN domain-containing protein [Calothrix sp. 336/3]AKG22433.1 fimbrial protein [Calothrix sp. 336/3]